MSDSSEGGRPTLPEAIDARSIFGKGPPKPVLVVLTGPQLGHRILLEDAAIIGRDPHSDLMLTDDQVEWHHARVEPASEGSWRVVDLGASRTEVNGEGVGERTLVADDQILVGHTVLRFEIHDSIERAYDEAVLERLYKDELTGLLARRKYDIELRSAVAAASRASEPLAVLALDLDHLKRVNDRFGHLAGAYVITEVGRVLGEVIGTRGLACRMGGDEFGLALPRCGREDAEVVSRDLLAQVRAMAMSYGGYPISITISVGISLFPSHGRAPLELLRHADEALYRAKRAGGDRLTVYEP